MNLEDQAKELTKIIMQGENDNCTIDEALKDKKEEKRIGDLTFRVNKSIYKQTKNYRNEKIFLLKVKKIRLQLNKYFSSLIATGVHESDKITDRIDETYNKLLQEKELLIDIKNSMKELEKLDASKCNSQIFLLVFFINLLNKKLIEDLDEYIQWYNTSNNGITYYENKTNEEEIEDLQRKVEYFRLKLGLSYLSINFD